MSEGRRWWNGAGRRALWPDPEKRWRALVGGPSGPTALRSIRGDPQQKRRA
ncbi:hypothetical protein GLE_1744 [Lysobacter enzymogenes]|uniref:Uncharacterized protein n=1 Tax=Lysobacter enzymogenes TaxID=69 RepID=A0A0S2DEM7_LYSEN|nr:hypothetical protein GLE_1744 [Lysobacter enzymogenes]